jgi:Dual-action HEIGH metallo-peptidase
MILGPLLLAAACQSDAADGAPGFEDFAASVAREVDGKTLYIVEGDLPLTRDQLRDYYQQLVKEAKDDKAHYGTVESQLAVNRVGAADDLWSPALRFNLRYCVTNDFGALKARAVQEMAAATAAWERVADINFDYIPAQDGACTNANTNVTFVVRPWTGGGACAFFPSGGGCVPRTVVIDYTDFDTNPQWRTLAPNMTTGGVLIHELGHSLGFRHEHIRFPNGCLEDTNWRGVTTYDPSSTMHYPWCPGGVTASTLQLTSRDGEGAASLYGWYTNMNDADRRVEAAPNGDFWVVSDLAQSFRAPFAVTVRHVDACFYAGSGPTQATLRLGDNINGPVLATSTQISSTAQACGWPGMTFTRFTFADTALLGANSYTVRFSANGQIMGLVVTPSNPYSGGALWDIYNGGGRRQDAWDASVRIVRPAP